MENFTAPERETIINLDDGSDLARIWTAQRPVITKLRKHPGFTEVASGLYGSSPWAEFTAPADKFTFTLKRAVTSDSRAKMAERAKARGWGSSSENPDGE